VSGQANFVENVTAQWASGGINHPVPKAEGWEPILKIVANGYGRLALVDDMDHILVSFNPDSPPSVEMLGRYVTDFLNAIHA
jgi:hypothetical protein